MNVARSHWLLLGVLGTTGIGLLGSNTMPVFVGSLLEGFGLDESGVGLLGSIELSGVALGSLAVTPLVKRRSRRAMALLGVALAGAGFLTAFATGGASALGLARFGAGLGCGIALASGNAAGSAHSDPDRLFARVALFGGAISAVILGLLPLVVSAWGFRGGYLALTGICVLAVPLLVCLPPTAEASSRGAVERLPDRALGAATLVSITLFWLADQALWTFTERIGTGVGLSLEQVGAVLAGGTVVGLLGAVAASALGVSRGRTLPLALGLLGIGCVRVALTGAWSPVSYAALQLCWAATFLFAVPYTIGTAAALDSAGRWAAAASAVGMAGTALGPAPAGYLMAQFGPTGLAWFLLAASFASLAIMIPVSLALDRRAPARAVA